MVIKNKNLKRILVIFSIILIVSSMIISTTSLGISDFVKSKYKGDPSVEGNQSIVKTISTTLDIVRTVGIAIAIIILMVIATKYIISSAGDKADIKKYALNYIIGAVILFAASGILSIVRNVITSSIE